MLYQFTKTKPPFKKLWKDIKETFQKPLYGHTVDTVRFTILVHISSATEFNQAKKLMKSDIAEDEFAVLTKYHQHPLSSREVMYQHLIPNPAELPMTLLLSLMHNGLPGTYANIVGNDVPSSDKLDMCFHKGENSIVEILDNPSIVLDNLQEYFTHDVDLAAVPVYSRADLDEYILNSYLIDNIILPKFIYDVEANTLSTSELDMEDIQPEVAEASEGTIEATGYVEPYKPRSIRVAGNRDAIGHIDRTHSFPEIEQADWRELTEEQYKATNPMRRNGSDGITIPGKCEALCYIKKTDKLDIVELSTPNFDDSCNAVILRYKEL